MPWDEYMNVSASSKETVGGLDSAGTRQQCTYIWTLIGVVLVSVLFPAPGPNQERHIISTSSV